MGRRLQLDIVAPPERTFDVQILIWLELTRRLEDPCPSGADGHAHDRAMDVIYTRRAEVETWLCDQHPQDALQCLCLMEIVRRHDDEVPERYLQALESVQSWLAECVERSPEQEPARNPSLSRLLSRYGGHPDDLGIRS